MATSNLSSMFVAHLGPHLSVAAAAGLVVIGGLAWGVGRTAGTSRRRLLLGLALAGLGFQVVHALEHVLQLGYWVWHPTETSWLTPWASSGRDVLARVAGGSASAGSELLHLSGNLIFLSALGALRCWASAPRPRSLRQALLAQGVHVGEHVILTATTLAMGHALGVTTGFGLLSPGTALATAIRVWSHFGLNLVATWFALSALGQITSEPRRDHVPDVVGTVEPRRSSGERDREKHQVLGPRIAPGDGSGS